MEMGAVWAALFWTFNELGVHVCSWKLRVGVGELELSRGEVRESSSGY